MQPIKGMSARLHMLLLVAQLSPVMNSTTAYGFELVTISRRQKGSRDKVDVQAPKAVKCYNGNMGGVDELDGLRAGNYGCEGKGRALKWSNRLFDCMINVLFQTSYNVYRHCRRLKLENDCKFAKPSFFTVTGFLDKIGVFPYELPNDQ